MMLNFEEKRRLCEILKMFHILLQLQLLIIAGAHPSFARDVFLLIFFSMCHYKSHHSHGKY